MARKKTSKKSPKKSTANSYKISSKTIKPKKRLTQAEEFEILKLVLDKFLWLGFGIMAFGLYKIFIMDFTGGITWIVMGAIILIIFMVLIVKEYEIIA